MSFKKAFETAEKDLARMGYTLDMNGSAETVRKDEQHKFGGSLKTDLKRRRIQGTDKYIAVRMEKVTGMKASYQTFLVKNDLKGIEFTWVYADHDPEYIKFING